MGCILGLRILLGHDPLVLAAGFGQRRLGALYRQKRVAIIELEQYVTRGDGLSFADLHLGHVGQRGGAQGRGVGILDAAEDVDLRRQALKLRGLCHHRYGLGGCVHLELRIGEGAEAKNGHDQPGENAEAQTRRGGQGPEIANRETAVEPAQDQAERRSQ